MILIISYDLGKPDRDYKRLEKVIESFGLSCNCLGSVWLVKTEESIKSISSKLGQVMDEDDRYMMIEVSSLSQYFLNLPDNEIETIKNIMRI